MSEKPVDRGQEKIGGTVFQEEKEFNIAFQKLTPTNDADLDGYEEAFDFVFDNNNNDILNVAVFGPYGAGKSSVLQTYAQKHKEREFLYISLAQFDSVQRDPLQKPKAENTLEGKIINHLVNQIPVKDIPQTRLRVNRDVSKWPYILIAIGIVVVLAALMYFTHMADWIEWVTNFYGVGLGRLLGFTTTVAFQIILAILAVAAFSYGLYRIMLLQAERRFIKRLSFQGAEMELFDEERDSFFDKYSNEVRYLLRRIKADAIVFEDIDRYDNAEIFEKIRELNALGNYQKKKPLRFFYVMRDDLLSVVDRTKFFDYIIPIVPFINVSNSYEKLNQYLEEAVPSHQLKKHFLREMSLYIDDIRLIKTMVNEFAIYEYKLRKIDPEHNKLLSIIAYKNMFPEDYVRLQRDEGYVFRIFKDWADVTEDANGEQNMNQQTLAEEIDGHLDSKRFDCVGKTNEGNNAFGEIRENKYYELLKYFIANGYIDESYNDYLTFFYPGTISLNDKRFLRAIADGKEKPYDYSLDNVAELIENWVDEKKFKRKSVLNYDLIKQLLHLEKGETYLPIVIGQLRENGNLDFVISFYCLDLIPEERNTLVSLLNANWPEFFGFICETEGDLKLQDMVRSYSIITLLTGDDAVLTSMNEEGALSDYISAQSDFLECDLTQEQKKVFIHGLQVIDVKFAKIYEEPCDETLLKMVYESYLYELNEDNLELFLRLKYVGFKEKDKDRCITVIHSCPDEPLCKYFVQEPDKGLSAVLNLTDDAFCDKEEEVVMLLNNDDISAERRAEYLYRSKTQIANLKEIENESFYDILLKKKRVAPIGDNMLWYSRKRGFNQELTKFLNDVGDEMEYSTTGALSAEQKNYYQDALRLEDLGKEGFRKIVDAYCVENIRSLQSGLPPKHVEVLAEEGRIVVSPQSLKCVREKYNSAMKAYICSDMKRYLALPSSEYKEDAAEILSWPEVSIEDKVTLFKRAKAYLEQRYLQLEFDLLDALLKEPGIDKQIKLNLARGHIAGVNSKQRDIILMDLGAKDIVEALKRNKPKSIALKKENGDFLQMLKDAHWILDYQGREERKDYHFTPNYRKT